MVLLHSSMKTLDSVTIDIQIRYADLDTLGHVNNAVYLSYFELGRIEYLRRILDHFELEDINFVIARIEIDFRKSILFHHPLSLRTSVDRVGRTSLTFLQVLYNRENEETFSTGKVTVVFIDKNRRPVEVPPGIRKAAQTGVET